MVNSNIFLFDRMGEEMRERVRSLVLAALLDKEVHVTVNSSSECVQKNNSRIVHYDGNFSVSTPITNQLYLFFIWHLLWIVDKRKRWTFKYQTNSVTGSSWSRTVSQCPPSRWILWVEWTTRGEQTSWINYLTAFSNDSSIKLVQFGVECLKIYGPLQSQLRALLSSSSPFSKQAACLGFSAIVRAFPDHLSSKVRCSIK